MVLGGRTWVNTGEGGVGTGRERGEKEVEVRVSWRMRAVGYCEVGVSSGSRGSAGVRGGEGRG